MNTTKNTYYAGIAGNIKKYRLLHGMTQEEMAEKLDIDTQYYAQLERGERNFTIDKIVKVCQIFQIGVDKIIEIEEQTKNDSDYVEIKEECKKIIEKLPYSKILLLKRFLTEFLPYS